MPYRKVSHEDKQRIIYAHDHDEDYFKVARILNIKRTTAWAIIRRHQLTGVVVLPRGGA